MATLASPSPCVKAEPGLRVPCPDCGGLLAHTDGPFGEDWACPACAGRAARRPFRPLKAAPDFSWHVAEDGRVSVFIRKGRKESAYHVFPLHTDFGGVAFRWHKLDGSGTVHDLTLNGEHSSCDCRGWCYTGSCRHLHCTAEMIAAGVLDPAPESAGCDDAA